MNRFSSHLCFRSIVVIAIFCLFFFAQTGKAFSGIAGDLQLGSRGTEVVSLQDKLRGLGYFPKGIGSTGYFGTITKRAVKDFQKAQGIPATGYVGPLTRKVLAQVAHVASGTNTSASVSLNAATATLHAAIYGQVLNPTPMIIGRYQEAERCMDLRELVYPAPPEPDVDLHVYAADGRHVGMNYKTGEFEKQVSGEFSGNQFNGHEWIILPISLPAHFLVSDIPTAQFINYFPGCKSVVGDTFSIQMEGRVGAAPPGLVVGDEGATSTMPTGSVREISRQISYDSNGTPHMHVGKAIVTIDSLLGELEMYYEIAVVSEKVFVDLHNHLLAAKNYIQKQDKRSSKQELDKFEGGVSVESSMGASSIGSASLKNDAQELGSSL
jgi:Putative peptidoglycan binding domain